MFDISCSIVLYRNPVSEVRKAVESFLSCNLNTKLFLVDNSPEDSMRYEFQSPRIEYIFTGRNLGFGAGHNLAIRKCIGQSRFHLILNPDVEFGEGTISAILQFMSTRKQVGLVMPKVLYRSGDIQFQCKLLPSPADLFVRRFVPGPVKFLFRSVLDRYELKHHDYNSIMEIANLSGCFMCVRTDVFRKVGLFDEQYFLYFEDTDLSRRINEHYQTVYYPRVSVVHGYRRASHRVPVLFMHHLLSSVKYFNKWGWFVDSRRVALNAPLMPKSQTLPAPNRFGRLRSGKTFIDFSIEATLTPAS